MAKVEKLEDYISIIKICMQWKAVGHFVRFIIEDSQTVPIN